MVNDKLNSFILKAQSKHSGENLDYSQAVYINNRTKLKIIDHDLDENGNEYGEFWITPSNHLRGQSHPNKRCAKISKNKSMSQEEVILRFKKVHEGENLDYSQVVYKNMHTKVKIISHDLDENGNEYGEFWQEPCVHLKGCSHPKIGYTKTGKASSYDTKTFIDKCKQVYGEDRYSYDKVEYVNSKTKVAIYCNKESDGVPHGLFYTSPDLFLQGKGCPICGHQLSKNENEIYNIICDEIGSDNVIHNDTTLLNGLELDIYVPSKNLAIEYDGLRWHSEYFKKDEHYHYNKTKECNDKGIRLIHIFEDEYIEHKEVVVNKIKHILNADINNKCIGARKCTVKEISNTLSNKFLETYHIQGSVASSIYLGAFYDDELVAVMTFKREKRNCYDLNRFSTKTEYRLPGIASKIFKYFIRKYNPDRVKSFLDRRWNQECFNNVYNSIGFEVEAILPINYSYIMGNKRFHKFSFRKPILSKKYNLPLSMTEHEMCQAINAYRIWDCGLVRYVWTKK